MGLRLALNFEIAALTAFRSLRSYDMQVPSAAVATQRTFR
jgi:hypothetical protein